MIIDLTNVISASKQIPNNRALESLAKINPLASQVVNAVATMAQEVASLYSQVQLLKYNSDGSITDITDAQREQFQKSAIPKVLRSITTAEQTLAEVAAVVPSLLTSSVYDASLREVEIRTGSVAGNELVYSHRPNSQSSVLYTVRVRRMETQGTEWARFELVWNKIREYDLTNEICPVPMFYGISSLLTAVEAEGPGISDNPVILPSGIWDYAFACMNGDFPSGNSSDLDGVPDYARVFVDLTDQEMRAGGRVIEEAVFYNSGDTPEGTVITVVIPTEGTVMVPRVVNNTGASYINIPDGVPVVDEKIKVGEAGSEVRFLDLQGVMSNYESTFSALREAVDNLLA